MLSGKKIKPAFLLASLKVSNKNETNYPRIALIPGSSFPSRYSSIAPPPVET
jgi:hypothetical protein